MTDSIKIGSINRVNVLRRLAKEGPGTAYDISGELGIRYNTTFGVLKWLKNEGFIDIFRKEISEKKVEKIIYGLTKYGIYYSIKEFDDVKLDNLLNQYGDRYSKLNEEIKFLENLSLANRKKLLNISCDLLYGKKDEKETALANAFKALIVLSPEGFKLSKFSKKLLESPIVRNVTRETIKDMKKVEKFARKNFPDIYRDESK